MHTSSYLSPASLLIPAQATGPDSMAGFPPTFVVYGGAERLAVSIKILFARLQLARKLEKNASLPDCLIEGPDSPHDFMIFPWMAEESATIYSRLDEWLRDLLASDYEVEVVPTSPEEAKSPDWSRIALARRQSRKLERDGMKTARSPVLEPKKHGMMDMVGDMRSEGIRQVANSSGEWLSNTCWRLTAQSDRSNPARLDRVERLDNPIHRSVRRGRVGLARLGAFVVRGGKLARSG